MRLQDSKFFISETDLRVMSGSGLGIDAAAVDGAEQKGTLFAPPEMRPSLVDDLGEMREEFEDIAQCPLCMQNHAKDRWMCMRYCACQFHASCIELWRSECHNLCPVCEAQISEALFFTLYLGRVLVSDPIEPTDACGGGRKDDGLTLIAAAKEQALALLNQVIVKIKVDATHSARV
jgi:hypothetical protein